MEENDGAADDASSPRQIFVSKGVKQQAAGARAPVQAVSGEQRERVLLPAGRARAPRLGPVDARANTTVDPTLNIEPDARRGRADIAFTGQDDKVVWTVWYEKDASAVPGLRNNEMVFAAKAVANAAADGRLPVGRGRERTEGQSNVLDGSGAHHFGPCAESEVNEDACALNADTLADAENPRVAAGSLTPGQPTVPWVVWEEDIAADGMRSLVSRLVGGDHFELFKPGQSISNRPTMRAGPTSRSRGNVPYISWQEESRGASSPSSATSRVERPRRVFKTRHARRGSPRRPSPT